MDFTWMEDIPLLKKVKDLINIRHRMGDVFSRLPKTGVVPRAGIRKHGISVYISVRNEADWIEPTIRSMAPFVDQWSFVDNGSHDDTVEIIRRVAEDLSLDYVLELHPDTDFGVARDIALHNTTCNWVIRWDGDIICRTGGAETFQKIRDYVLSLDQDCFYTIYFPVVILDGDMFHQNIDRPMYYEDYLLSYSPKMYHTHRGRMRELRYPFYYKRIYLWTIIGFHLWGIDDPETMLIRKYLEAWRKHDDFETYPTQKSYVEAHIPRDYGTESMDEAAAMLLRERFRKLVPYNAEKYGDYPDLLKPHLDTWPLKIIYRDGVIAGRSDVMDTLDRLDEQKKRMTVDVIVPTRNREDICVDTVRMLLDQDYPNFGVIVCDQSDKASEKLIKISKTNEKLVYHRAETRGLPAGRNEALTLSTADIVIFVDDDVIPDKGFIFGHVSAYIHDAIGVAAGKITERDRSRMKPVPLEKIGRIDYWTGDIKRGFITDSSIDVDTAQGCNMSFRREVLLDSGGFDERYGGTALLEETDAVLSVRKTGFTVRYTPYASLTHLALPTGGCRMPDEIADIYWYGHNSILLFFKHFPRHVFPVWCTVRIGKFLRDSVRMKSLQPFVTGLKSMFDGYRTYRTPKKSGGLPGSR